MHACNLFLGPCDGPKPKALMASSKVNLLPCKIHLLWQFEIIGIEWIRFSYDVLELDMQNCFFNIYSMNYTNYNRILP